MYVCLDENKNGQLETLSVYRRTLLGVCGACPLRQKILRTALTTAVFQGDSASTTNDAHDLLLGDQEFVSRLLFKLMGGNTF